MKSILLAAAPLLLALLPTGVVSYGSTLEDCKTVAKLFRNTCTTAPDSPADFSGTFASTSVTCSNMDGCPTGGGTAPNCVWQRKMCASCS